MSSRIVASSLALHSLPAMRQKGPENQQNSGFSNTADQAISLSESNSNTVPLAEYCGSYLRKRLPERNGTTLLALSLGLC